MRHALLMATLLWSGAAWAQTAPSAPAAPEAPVLWGAIAFTSNGSYGSAWGQASKAEAEANVLKRCTRYGSGRCEVISFQGRLCAALVTYSRGAWRSAFTGGGLTVHQALQAAHDNCKSDSRVKGACTLHTVVCGDGR